MHAYRSSEKRKKSCPLSCLRQSRRAQLKLLKMRLRPRRVRHRVRIPDKTKCTLLLIVYVWNLFFHTHVYLEANHKKHNRSSPTGSTPTSYAYLYTVDAQFQRLAIPNPPEVVDARNPHQHGKTENVTTNGCYSQLNSGAYFPPVEPVVSYFCVWKPAFKALPHHRTRVPIKPTAQPLTGYVQIQNRSP